MTVTTEYDLAKADVSSLKSSFESDVGLAEQYSGVYEDGVAATKAIANWGQTDAAYTLTSTNGSASLTLPKAVFVGGSGTSHNIEWQVTDTGGIVSSATATIGSYPPGADVSYDLANSTATAKTATFTFKIVNSADAANIIQGTITVTVSQRTPTVAEQEAIELETIKGGFTNWPTNNDNVLTFWADTPINAWGQTTAKYSATVTKSNSSSYGSDQYTLALPNTATWTYTGTAVTGITTSGLSSGSLHIDNNTIATS